MSCTLNYNKYPIGIITGAASTEMLANKFEKATYDSRMIIRSHEIGCTPCYNSFN